MGFLDDIMTKLGGQQGQEGGVASVQRMISASGGLHGLTSKLSSKGMGKQVQSWVGTGANQPVTGTQVRQAMDPAHLQQMAKQAGMTPEETSDHVARALPELVNQATPHGQIPESDPFAKGLDSVKHMLKI
jgi:uncharacterized protein YidB (DUF937 family)